jgi:predicted nuclease of predicted toxin-antitoxin system
VKLLIDMNLAPNWVRVLANTGHDARHWSEVGDQRASDTEIMAYALRHGLIVLTHDLDFGDIVAATGGAGPSVVQIRAEDVRVATIALQVVRALETCSTAVADGALLSADVDRARLRLLPLRKAT